MDVHKNTIYFLGSFAASYETALMKMEEANRYLAV